MNSNTPNRLECSEFETLLADALDSALTAEGLQSFEDHGRSCAVCGPLWQETRQGLALMRSLEELEPPRNLVHNILAATTMKEARAESAAAPVQGGWLRRLRGGWRPSLAGLM